MGSGERKMFFEQVVVLAKVCSQKKENVPLTRKEEHNRKASIEVTLLALCLRADTFDFCALA